MKTLNTILIDLQGVLYLQELQSKQRCGKSLTEKEKQRLERNFEQFADNGWKVYYDGDCGGALRNGKWTSWSCEEVKQILSEAGIKYKDGSKEEVINV